jgi:hypothetical protein
VPSLAPANVDPPHVERLRKILKIEPFVSAPGKFAALHVHSTRNMRLLQRRDSASAA